MKKLTAIQKIQSREIDSAEIMRNPTNKNEWFITLYSPSGLPHILVDNDESAILGSTIETMLEHLKQIGLHTSKITF